MIFRINNKRVKSKSVQMRLYPFKGRRIKKCRNYKRILLGVMLSVQYRNTSIYNDKLLYDTDKIKYLFNIESKFRTELLRKVLNRSITLKFKSLGVLDDEFQIENYELFIYDDLDRKLRFDMSDINSGFEIMYVPESYKVISNLNGRWKSYWNLIGINTNI